MDSDKSMELVRVNHFQFYPYKGDKICSRQECHNPGYVTVTLSLDDGSKQSYILCEHCGKSLHTELQKITTPDNNTKREVMN